MVPASPTALAATASPRGQIILGLPMGPAITGRSISCPRISVRRSTDCSRTPDLGLNRSLRNASTLSRRVISSSAPPR